MSPANQRGSSSTSSIPNPRGNRVEAEAWPAGDHVIAAAILNSIIDDHHHSKATERHPCRSHRSGSFPDRGRLDAAPFAKLVEDVQRGNGRETVKVLARGLSVLKIAVHNHSKREQYLSLQRRGRRQLRRAATHRVLRPQPTATADGGRWRNTTMPRRRSGW
jgi:hypothetical protein